MFEFQFVLFITHRRKVMPKLTTTMVGTIHHNATMPQLYDDQVTAIRQKDMRWLFRRLWPSLVVALVVVNMIKSVKILASFKTDQNNNSNSKQQTTYLHLRGRRNETNKKW